MAADKSIVIVGIFVADASFRAERQPQMGETILGNAFALGPGGKGSNQAVAAAMAGGDVHFITRLGADDFARLARDTWSKAGVRAIIHEDAQSHTGAACIFIEEKTGNNAIIVSPGAASRICPADMDENAALVGAAGIFMTQLEQPVEAARRGLEIAREAGVTTILNPAPAAPLPARMLSLCDYLTPNESEAERMTGIAVNCPEDGEQAARKLLSMGVGNVIVTLGENGALFCNDRETFHVAAVDAGRVVETTGAGDAFNGGFAAALSREMSPLEAVRYGTVTAAISVTRPGTAPSMPSRNEIDRLYTNVYGAG